MISNEGIRYIWRQVFHRLGFEYTEKYFLVGDKKISYSYRQKAVQQDEFDFFVNIQPCEKKAFETIFKKNKIKWIEVDKDIIPFPEGNHWEKIPILFESEQFNGKIADIERQILNFNVDIIAAIFFFLTRYEEYMDFDPDRHGRFPYEASIIKKFSIINIPVVDIYILIFKYWLEKLIGERIDYPHQFEVLLSHDIDFPYANWPIKNFIKNVLKSLMRLDFGHMVRSSLQFFQDESKDDYFAGIEKIIKISKEFDVRSIFFLMAERKDQKGGGYDLSSNKMERVINLIKQSGFEIGLHPSYQSFHNPDLLSKEKRLLEEKLGTRVKGCRMHYLRTRTPETWNHLSGAGFSYDHSYIFPQHEGFKCGTCFPFKVFDIEKDREMDFTEIPLIVMDTTLKNYRKLSFEEAKERILRLARTCKSVGGCFTMLWHNSSFSQSWIDWGDSYPDMIRKITDQRGNG